jgi:hypothetical protein
VTRRSLLATGGLAGAALAAGLRPWAPATAEAAADTPSYLIRSSYQSLSTTSFGTSLRGDTADLTLLSVDDLTAAATDKSLAGSEDAFSLSFSSSAPLTSEIHTFSHPDLGVFDLFIAPVENSGKYEVVVNRSVNAPKHYPKPPPTATTSPAPAVPKPDAPGVPKPRKPLIHRVRSRRAGRAVIADVTFEHKPDLKWAVVWLSRGGVVVGSATARHVHAKHVALRIPFQKRLRGGHYELTVGTMDRHRHDEYKKVEITLQ